MANDSIGLKARAQGPKAQGQARARGPRPRAQGQVKARAKAWLRPGLEIRKYSLPKTYVF